MDKRRGEMSYILVKVFPNYIPITTGSVSHYCDLDFVIYKCETQTVSGGEIEDFREAWERGSIHEGPRVVISAKSVPPGSIRSDDALCFSTDIPASGYAYAEPEGWDCSHTYNAETSGLSFTFRPPAERVSAFQAASIKIKSFFTTAQAGVCALQVRVENFGQFLPDVQDCTFTIALNKKYGLEILSFEANGMSGKFFLNHHLPVTFRWNMVCDTDTDFVLLEDDCRNLGAQGFCGEKNLEQRERGDHTYTLKMILPEGDKTRSIMIRDTRWRKLEDACSIVPDFSRQGYLLEYEKALYMFYDKKVYKSSLSKEYVLSDWTLLGSYDGNVIFSADTKPVICDGKLYLIGGKKKDGSQMFYTVCDLTAKSCSFQEFDTG